MRLAIVMEETCDVRCVLQEEKTRDKAVSLLLRRGADVNLRDDIGRTACAYACQLRCNDVVRILVKNNVNPDIADNNGQSLVSLLFRYDPSANRF